MKKMGLCLVITDKCSAACDICCFGCSPEGKNLMDEALMFKAIDQAYEAGGFYQIGFSGGEPFLYPELLKKGISYAKKLGFKTSVATNGFWGAWDDKKIYEQVYESGVDHIALSFDGYHEKFINHENFRRAVNVCKKMNISYSVGIGETKEKKANDLFKNMGDHKYLMKYYIYPFMRVGNAEKLPADIFFEYDETDKLVCNDNGLITVMYNGNVYPCCSQAVFDTALKIGNIKESTLSQILESDVTKMFFRILKDKKEFSKLAEKSSEILGIDIPKKCTSTCEICRKIFLNKENLEALIPCIKSITEKSAIDRLLRRG